MRVGRQPTPLDRHRRRTAIAATDRCTFTSLLHPPSRGERRRKEQLLAFNFELRLLQEPPAVGSACRKDVRAGVGEGLDDDDDGDEDSPVTS